MKTIEELLSLVEITLNARGRAAVEDLPYEMADNLNRELNRTLTTTLGERDARIAELEDTLNRQEADLRAMLYCKDDDDRRFVDDAAMKFLAAEIAHTGMRELLEGDVAMAVDNAEALLAERKRREGR